MLIAEHSDFGRRVRSAREARGLSQQELASRSGIARKTVNEIEGGRAIPGLESVLTISSALGLSLHLIARDSDATSPTGLSLDAVLEDVARG